MKKVIDGCTAASQVAYKFSELASIYPITPSSPMASNMDKLSTLKEKNFFGFVPKVIEMQSEAGAAGAMHGALLSGVLASTFTSSQGLLLMIPNLYKIAGEELPLVMHVAARTVASHALSIFGDHSDIYAIRSTGVCMLASESVQATNDLAAVAHLSAISASMPFVHFFDGFRTSHEINKIKTFDMEKLESLIDKDSLNKFRSRSLNINHSINYGLAENEDIYFQSVEARNKDYELVPKIVENYMDKINELQGTDYKPFNYYGSASAKYVIIAMGSITSTIKEVVEELVTNNERVGVIVTHLYRPFSMDHLLKVLPKTTKRIAVLDRTKEHGAGEPLYLDVLNALKNKDVEIYGGRYGLASKNTTPSDILAVYKMLEENPKDNFTIGIVDDLTNLSLPKIDYTLKKKVKELIIYGYGSDGMISASKDILKIIGNNTSEYVQGYFEYDSKKSGGVTVSHMRFASNPIDLPFYPEHPNIMVVTKSIYLNKFELTKNIAQNGVLIINTSKTFDKLHTLPSIKKDLKKKNITIFTIDAENIARKNNLSGKISLIFETILLKLLGFNDYKKVLKDSIKKRFETKGQNIVNANIACMNDAIESLVPYTNDIIIKESEYEENNEDVIDSINKRKGYELSVSDLYDYRTGAFPTGLSKLEKRNISDLVPIWKSENCTECGMCSIVCPHAVIRPFVIDRDDPKSENGISLIGGDEKYKFLISVSEADCTGCGLCIETCPGKGGKKALAFGTPDIKRQKLANTLFNFYKNPNVFDKFTIKGSQLESPAFEFSGACAGCGETPYIKLLSQLFKSNLMIANATGCSSIYGGSVPSTPYSIPWANSLFEDNAEFAFGIAHATKTMKENIKNIMENAMDSSNDVLKELYETWINNMDNYEITKKVKEELSSYEIPENLKNLLDYMEAVTVWAIGGDGWAYDIGFSGIDHVLSSNINMNILVLDTEVYSNTGGQASKSSRLGQVCEFTDDGKKTEKKDLFKIAMTYPNAYVASVSLGANMFHTIKAFKEANMHNGPSIIIAYSPCIEQGIKSGMNCSNLEARKAVECGYTLLMRYSDGVLSLDSKEPDFTKYEDFLDGEVRYNALKIKNPEYAEELLKLNKESAKRRYEFYKNIANK